MNRTPLLWIVALIVALVAGWQLASAQGEKEKGAQKWEYKAMPGGDDLIPHEHYMKELAKLGDEGWELVTVEPATRYGYGKDQTGQSYRVFHLKRPK